jgi:hypothetical protein
MSMLEEARQRRDEILARTTPLDPAEVTEWQQFIWSLPDNVLLRLYRETTPEQGARLAALTPASPCT